MHHPEASRQTPELTAGERRDLYVLALFTAIYCQARHDGAKAPLVAAAAAGEGRLTKHRICPSCQDFLDYAFERRLKCPLTPKPSCKHCPIHCYRPGHREMVREIMRFSGKKLILRGRLDLLWHYLF